MSLSADEFIRKWGAVELRERQAAQEHFIDLCRMLGEPTPAEADSEGSWYCFERGATKTTGGDGWADVWKREHFGWEYKGKHKDLEAAFVQLQRYALGLENPPLLVTCDMDRIIIRTNWNNSVSHKTELTLEDLRDARNRDILKAVMSDPERLRPGVTREDLTESAAGEFATLAGKLQSRDFDPHRVAHFVNRLVFCMFAEDVQLLPNKMFSRLLEEADRKPSDFVPLASALFAAMRSGGRLGFERVDHFNGGLFDDDEALPLNADEIAICRKVAALDWGDIDPSILGTLFERGLDPAKRWQRGSHYTDFDKIMLIVDPVIIQPLTDEWRVTKARILDLLASAEAAKGGQRTKLRNTAARLYSAFLERLRAFRVLDPACGSGNFLYVALRALKDIEHRAGLEAEALGLGRAFPSVGPENVLGLEINPYAAELARVAVWIGEIQWMRRNGFDVGRHPILRPLANIEQRDALLTLVEGDADTAPPSDLRWVEAEWPRADVIVGNPQFLGGVEHLSVLEPAPYYANALRASYRGRVAARADLVVYWVQRATELLIEGGLSAFGLVTTKSVAKGVSRRSFDTIDASPMAEIFNAWTNEEWTVEGADVRVSITCARRSDLSDGHFCLNGAPVDHINPDLTTGIDITKATRLAANQRVAFQGVKLTGPFDIPGDEARRIASEPANPNGFKNAAVIRRLYDIDDIVGRDSDRWVIDFGTDMSRGQAALFETPFSIIQQRVVPWRANPEMCRSTEARLTEKFWEFQRPRPEMRSAVRGLSRFIVTPESSEHRVFVFVPGEALIQGSLFAIARSDHTTLGLLSSRIHEIWSTAQGNRLGVGNQRRYNIGVTFETFPFPTGMSLGSARGLPSFSTARRIANAARKLDRLRKHWLNPPELVVEVAETDLLFPPRLRPLNDVAAATLQTRTLTALYNLKPQWLLDAHAELDDAVAAAYGWPADIDEHDVLARLLELNQQR